MEKDWNKKWGESPLLSLILVTQPACHTPLARPHTPSFGMLGKWAFNVRVGGSRLEDTSSEKKKCAI